MSDVLAKCTGTLQPIRPMNGECYTLLEMQHYVGGYIETVNVGNGKVLIVDGEGKLKGKLPNRIATGWLQMEGIHDWVVGDAMLIDRKHIK